MPKHYSFTEYLQDIHGREYTGTDDKMPDAFESWLGALDLDELIQHADLYGDLRETRAVKN